MTEHMCFVREAGEVEYDIIYVPEHFPNPDGSMRFIELEDLHNMVKAALGKNEEITKITLDEIAIKNVNGIKFMFKKHEPRIEVTFQRSLPAQNNAAYGSAYPAYGNPQQMAPAPYQSYQAPPVAPSGDAAKWLTVLEVNPFSFGHSGTSVNDHLFVFGGFADDLTTNHCLLLSDTNTPGKFSRLKTRGDAPPPRERHSANLLGKKLFIFGGYNRGPETYYNSVYVFDTENLTWTKMQPRGFAPERRCGHTGSVVDGKIYVIGGRVKVKLGTSFFSGTTVEYRNDVHCYDPNTNEWMRFEPRGIPPAGRALHSATVIGRKIYIFGGANSTGTSNDTSGFCDLFELDVDTMTWTECETKSTPPSPCYGHTANHIGNNQLLIYGGRGYKVLNTIHVIDIKKLEWKQMAYAGNALAPRWGHSATLHDTRILLYAGRHAEGYHNTIEFIDTTSQLIELEPEELAKEEIKRKREEKNIERESVGNLQRSVHSLQEMMGQLGAELMKNRALIADTANRMNALWQQNENTRKKLNMQPLQSDFAPETSNTQETTNTEQTETNAAVYSYRDDDY